MLGKSKSFPILRLPIIAIEEVLSTMLPFEILNFARVSNKCKFLTNSLSKRRNPFRIQVSIEDTLEIQIKNWPNGPARYIYQMTKDARLQGVSKSREIHGGANLNVRLEYETILVYSYKDLWEDFKKLFQFLKEALDIWIVEGLKLDFNQGYAKNRDVIDWLKLQTRNILSVTISGTNSEDVKFFFDKFSMENMGISLHINNGDWVTLEKFLEFKSPSVYLSNHNLTNQEIGTVISKFMSLECLQKLNVLRIEIKKPEDLTEVLVNISHTVEQLQGVLFRNAFPVTDVWCLKRSDGAGAKIFLKQIAEKLFLCMATDENFSTG